MNSPSTNSFAIVYDIYVHIFIYISLSADNHIHHLHKKAATFFYTALPCTIMYLYTEFYVQINHLSPSFLLCTISGKWAFSFYIIRLMIYIHYLYHCTTGDFLSNVNAKAYFDRVSSLSYSFRWCGALTHWQSKKYNI